MDIDFKRGFENPKGGTIGRNKDKNVTAASVDRFFKNGLLNLIKKRPVFLAR